MTEGTQPQEQLEKIPESKDFSDSRVELDQATHKSAETVELRMEVPAAEKVQEEFTALVDTTAKRQSDSVDVLPPNLPPESSPSGGQDQFEAGVSTNQEQAVADQVEGQVDTVKGAVDGLQAASEAIGQEEDQLDEPQSETTKDSKGDSSPELQKMSGSDMPAAQAKRMKRRRSIWAARSFTGVSDPEHSTV